MNIHSILAVTDFSTQAEHGLDRAAMLAVAHQAKLQVMYLAESSHPGLSDPVARLAQRARQLARRHGIAVTAVSRNSDSLDDVVAQSNSADLIVVDQRRERAFNSLWKGSVVEQLMRRCPCPVLVVKQPPLQRHRHMLIAIDFTVQSHQLVRYAWDFEGESELELFHASDAFDDSNRGSPVMAPRVTTYLKEVHRYAEGRSFTLTDANDTRRNRVNSLNGNDDPARQAIVRQETSNSDLIVVSMKRRSAFADFLFGSVAQRLAQWAPSDVLVVPHDYRASSRLAAKARIQTDLNEGCGRFPIATLR